MLSTILVYMSLLFQVLAAAIAISLFKRTKFNASWILISTGFILMVVSRIFELFPTIYPEWEEELAVVQKCLAFVISLVLLIGVFYIRKIFQFMRRLDEIRRETENKVLSAVIRTEERERQRFAKELHDGLGPLLSVVKMLLSGLSGDAKPEVNEKIKQNLKQAVDEAIISVRDISANISPHILNNFGLKDAVDSFIKKLRSAKALDISFTTNIGNRRFGYNVEVIMYRVICELINNTLRHAEADKIRIELKLTDEIIYLTYTDNGIGFDVSRQATKYGMGLDNMQYRLKSGNGGIEIMSERGKGMQAKAFIKL
ncbi:MULTISPECIES: sensor histidine kinase [Culturomica]|jgi:signal transduction histidine kinase|uniref:sensor histidine kinase n=1 Tax=Culturomica TaxID=1926651 RepID=UPI0003370089|nr:MULTISPECIES: histidine kinase [Odoribacteraceae]RHV98386.1 two-component sensor histidine kinase [Odoribacter sp. OF09-27XD]CCZ09621.1 putative uncharacterized protein [Odoribacter sp. CAG:788]HBO25699.1 two-component sensor histidine kinase [Culturomica sp.]